MKDVQGEKDLRCVPLKHVGIKDLRWPIELRDKTKGTQHTVAKVTLAVDLPRPPIIPSPPMRLVIILIMPKIRRPMPA